jgi:hypothetical protein
MDIIEDKSKEIIIKKQYDYSYDIKNLNTKKKNEQEINEKDQKKETNIEKLDSYLEFEKEENENVGWYKLSTTSKINKLFFFTKKYSELNKCSLEEEELLFTYLKDCINKKKLKKMKDVLYDKNEKMIIDIPGLIYQKNEKRFTLKNMDKKIGKMKNQKNEKSDKSE